MKLRLILILLIILPIATRGQNDNQLSNLKPIIQVFGTASYNTENDQYNYSFGRAHLGFQYQFNEKWSAKIIIDRGRATSVGEITAVDSAGHIINVTNTSKEGAYYTMFLKFASMRFDVNDRLSLEGGAILQNHYITQERFWGLRYVAQTFQDLHWHIPSSDLGFIAYYKLNDVFSFDAALTNGEGPRKIQDPLGKTKIAFGVNANPTKKIQSRIYYHRRQANVTVMEDEQMFSVFTGIKASEKIRIGGEINYVRNLDNTNKLNSFGGSVYSAFSITSKTLLFVRYDRLNYNNPDIDIMNIYGNGNTIIGGVSHSPVKGVDLSLNYQGFLPDKNEDSPKNMIQFSMAYKFI